MFSLKLKSVIAKINYKNSLHGLSSRGDDRGKCQWNWKHQYKLSSLNNRGVGVGGELNKQWTESQGPVR